LIFAACVNENGTKPFYGIIALRIRIAFMNIAIVGAGPSGAHLACELAAAGGVVRVYDLHAGAWEKPCGGGVTAKALRHFDFLTGAHAEHPRQEIDEIDIISPLGRAVTFPLNDAPFLIFSRRALNGLLLERAGRAGADFIPRRVTGFSPDGAGWRIRSDGDDWKADFIVGADGCTSFVRRQLIGRLPDADQAMCCGYYIPMTGVRRAVVAFPKDFTGYVWAFPRPDHVSYGIINACDEYPAPHLWKVLDAFIRRHLDGEPPKERVKYAARVPMLRKTTWQENRAAGKNWALVGDAAGFVDPITGEGIYYALRSAELLAQAMRAGTPAAYEQKWRADFEADLTEASRRLPKFYRGSMLGGSVIDRVLLLAGVHGGVGAVMSQALAGDVDYVTLKRRVMTSFITPSHWTRGKLKPRMLAPLS
jgi:geranylgeranyl reductase family protein